MCSASVRRFGRRGRVQSIVCSVRKMRASLRPVSQNGSSWHMRTPPSYIERMNPGSGLSQCAIRDYGVCQSGPHEVFTSRCVERQVVRRMKSVSCCRWTVAVPRVVPRVVIVAWLRINTFRHRTAANEAAVSRCHRSASACTRIRPNTRRRAGRWQVFITLRGIAAFGDQIRRCCGLAASLLGSIKIFACASGSPSASKAASTPGRPTVPVISGAAVTLPPASMCKVSRNSSGV